MKRSIKVLLWVAAANLLLVYTLQIFAYRNESAMNEAISPILDRAMAEGVDTVRVEGSTFVQPMDIYDRYMQKPFLTVEMAGSNSLVPVELDYSEGELVIKTVPEAKVYWHIHKVEE